MSENTREKLMDGLETKDVSGINIDCVDDCIVVKLTVEGVEFSEYIPQAKMPDHVLKPVAEFVAHIVKSVRDRHLGGYKSGPPLCVTCRGACCYRYDEVHVTEKDLDRLALAEGVDVDASVEMKPTFSGYVGVLRKAALPKKITGEKGTLGCVFLTEEGCSVYDHRPDTCREYSAWGCDTYEEDPRKKKLNDKGKRTLRVVQ